MTPLRAMRRASAHAAARRLDDEAGIISWHCRRASAGMPTRRASTNAVMLRAMILQEDDATFGCIRRQYFSADAASHVSFLAGRAMMRPATLIRERKLRPDIA